MVKRIFIITVLILLFSCSAGGRDGTAEPTEKIVYNELGLGDAGVSFEAFDAAYDAFVEVEGRQREVLTLIDFTLPSTEQRLWVIDMEVKKILFNTWVAHGQGSGENYATAFSNRAGSHQSSLGAYLTGETYTGRNGYSMILNGLERGVNDNARSRAVVVHGAAYVDPGVIASAGRLGRSWGCPALPVSLARPIIDAIKDGSVLYIYGREA